MPRKKTPPRRDALLTEALLKIPTLDIRERYLYDSSAAPKWKIRGCCTIGRNVVWVSPGPDIVEILLHETLHLLRPDWTEATVTRRTKRLWRSLSRKELKTIYDLYLSRRQRPSSKPLDISQR